MALDSAQAEGLKRSAVWKVREGGMDEARGDIVAGLVPVREEGLDSRQACCVQCTMIRCMNLLYHLTHET